MCWARCVQGDSTLRHVKDLDVVLGAEAAVLILDDTSGVWPLHQRNLLQVCQNPMLLLARSPAHLSASPVPLIIMSLGMRLDTFPLNPETLTSTQKTV